MSVTRTNVTYKEFTNRMGYKFVLRSKEKSLFHKLIAVILSVFGVNKSYMKYYTILLNRLVAPTRQHLIDIQNPNGMTPEHLGIIAHEGRHIEQRRKDGVLKHTFAYAFNKQARLDYEIDAYKVTLLVHYFTNNPVPSGPYISSIMSFLREGYGIPAKLLTNTEQELLSYYKLLKAGVHRPQDTKLVGFLCDRLPLR